MANDPQIRIVKRADSQVAPKSKIKTRASEQEIAQTVEEWVRENHRKAGMPSERLARQFLGSHS